MSTTSTREPWLPSLTRYNIAPLTTVFTPPAGCETGFVQKATAAPDSDRIHENCQAYLSDCRTSRPCLPGTSSWAPWAFYSPGLLCPAGWTTATVVSQDMTDSIRATDIFSLMRRDETAAFCCPS